MKLACRLFFLFVLSPCLMWGQHKHDIEDVAIDASRNIDSLHITITTAIPKMQLSFLMQGLRITILDSLKHPDISIELPNAKMVRDKIKHHPNEVKAMHRTMGDEVRPDLLPLISALNDTCCKANCLHNQAISCSHTIALDKTNGEMTFAVCILSESGILFQDSILVEILSSPMEMKSEFEGRRLSQENRMPPGGMGQPPKGTKDQSRIIRFSKMVRIGSCKANKNVLPPR